MIATIAELSSIVSDLKRSNKKIVFTNGVFDILHRGHVDYLNKSKGFGDILIVGINSDRSVKRLKGDERPLNCEEDRAVIIDSLKSVDYAVIFEDDTPYSLISLICPDFLVKGGDYDPLVTDPSDKKYIVGSDIIKNNGGKVFTVSLVPGRSSTITIKKLSGK